MKNTKVKFHEWVWFGGAAIITGGVISALESQTTDHILLSSVIVIIGVIILFASMGLEKLGKRTRKPVE